FCTTAAFGAGVRLATKMVRTGPYARQAQRAIGAAAEPGGRAVAVARDCRTGGVRFPQSAQSAKRRPAVDAARRLVLLRHPRIPRSPAEPDGPKRDGLGVHGNCRSHARTACSGASPRVSRLHLSVAAWRRP